jgi:hypothetical protein
LSISILFVVLITLNAVNTPNPENGSGLITVDSASQPNAQSESWIGIRMGNISSPMAEMLGLNESTGVLVTGVTAGGPAQKAGLRGPEVNINGLGHPIEVSGVDVILKMDNIPVRATTNISSVIQAKKAGDKIVLDVLRNGQINRVTVTPVPKPDYFVFNDPEGLYNVRYPSNWSAVNPDMLQQLGQARMIQNFEASFVKPGSGTSITITKNPGSAAGISDMKMKSMADEGFVQTLIQQNGTIIQDIECERYMVDGSKACSYVLGVRNGSPSNIMQVPTIVGEKAFVFTYRSSPENFDKDLPVLEEMLQSFNRTKLER